MLKSISTTVETVTPRSSLRRISATLRFWRMVAFVRAICIFFRLFRMILFRHRCPLWVCSVLTFFKSGKPSASEHESNMEFLNGWHKNSGPILRLKYCHMDESGNHGAPIDAFIALKVPTSQTLCMLCYWSHLAFCNSSHNIRWHLSTTGHRVMPCNEK